MAIAEAPRVAVAHPLEPLSAAEIARAVEILRSERGLGDATRFITVTLHEPDKAAVLGYRPGASVEREAFAILMDTAAHKTYEAVVSLTQGKLTSWEHIPGVQPSIIIDEFLACEAACKQDPRWQAAMRKRGIEDFDLCM